MTILETQIWATVDHPPQRVVSLVPSITDSLLRFGFGERLVGISDYCPWEGQGIPARRVGGVKSPDRDAILGLRPDLILADREENDEATISYLDESGALIWLQFAPSVQAVLESLSDLVRLFQGGEDAVTQLRMLESAVKWVRLSRENEPSVRYFCPIWKGLDEASGHWWMTFNAATYCSDLLKLLGGENCFSDRSRRYPLSADLGNGPAEAPGKRDQRYPRVSAEEVRLQNPEVILLPDEPYDFHELDVDILQREFATTDAVQHQRIRRVDGNDLTWNGIRIMHALESMQELFRLR